MADSMLTTIDNPFNPSTEYKEWWTWDYNHGYHTEAYLARIARVSDELSDEDYSLEVERAMDEIVRLDITGMYIKVPMIVVEEIVH